MHELTIEFDSAEGEFLPGETLRGSVSWSLSEPVTDVSIALIWYTEGRGTQDSAVIESKSLGAHGRTGSGQFSFQLPNAPYSFSGKLITLRWAIEAVASLSGRNDSRTVRRELILSPTKREILLHASS